MRIIVFLFVLVSTFGCKNNTAEAPNALSDRDTVKFHELKLVRDGSILSLELEKGTKKTIIKFPSGGTQTDVIISKNGNEVGALKLFIGDTSSSDLFEIVTDSTNMLKAEVYTAKYYSCSQMGSYHLILK